MKQHTEWRYNMYDIPIRYLASVFFDADSIVAKPQYIKGLQEALDDDRFMPTAAVEDAAGNRVSRIGFLVLDDDLSLVISGKRCDFTARFDPMRKDKSLSFDSFLKESCAKLGAVLSFFDRKAHRIALVREGLLPEMDHRELKAVADRIFHFPQTFVTDPPFEWDWRAATETTRSFGNKEELVNTLVTVKRLSGRLVVGKNETDFDRIRVDLDVNTSPKNTLERFNIKDVNAYFHSVLKWQSLLEEEVSNFLNLQSEVKNE